MDLKNMGALVGGLVVSVILLAAVLVPVIGSAQLTAGDEITYDSAGGSVNGSGNFKELTGSTAITYAVSDNGVSIDGGTPFTWATSATHGPILYTDAGYITVRAGTNVTTVQVYDANTLVTTTLTLPATITVADGVITADEVTLDYTYGYYAVETGGDYRCNVMTKTPTIYINSDADLHSFGMYTTGENDTYYFVNSDGTVTVTEDYTASVDIEKTLVDGTTDIYSVSSFVITVGEEEFTPYFVFAPVSVDGHETSGTIYDLLGIMPLLVTVGIIIGIVGMAFSRRE